MDTATPSTTGGTVRILSVDGGGIRGIIPAMVLAYLERVTGGFPIHRMFDLGAATSSGSMTLAPLFKPNPATAEQVQDQYIADGGDIFRRSVGSYIRPIINGPKYDATALENVARRTLGDTMLSECLTPLLVPCYDIERREATFFKSWRAATTPSDNFSLRDTVRAASAAPTYFAPALIHSASGERLAAIDGALYANNPAMCALAEARVLYPGASRFIIVSLGVGEFRNPIRYEQAKGWGLLAWAQPVIDCCMDGSADTTHYQIANTFGSNVTYHRFQIDLRTATGSKANDPSDCIDDASDTNIVKLMNKAKALIANYADDLGRLAVTLPSYHSNSVWLS